MDATVKNILSSNKHLTGQLRVLMMTPFYGDGGGVGVCALELTKELRLRGVEVDVLHWWPNLNDPAFIDAKGERTPLNSLAELFESEREYDVIHFQSAAYSDRINGQLTKILERFSIPIVFTIHSLAAYHGEVMNNMEGMSNNIRDQVELMSHAQRIVLLTHDIVDIARRHHVEYSKKFVVIENGAHLPSVAPKRKTKGRRIMLYVGRISREKGIYELAAALPAIVKEFPDIKLVIAGDKPGDPNVAKIKERWAQEKLVSGLHYEFAGWVDGAAKEALYAKADFVIMPSHYEHMPVTALEAFAHQKPLIINDIESLRGLFLPHDDERRCVIPINDIANPAQIVAAVRFAVKRRKDVSAMVERAHNLFLSRFTWPRIAERVHELYQGLCAERKAEEEERFGQAFNAQFKKVFDLNFEGRFALQLGDYKSASELLCASFDINPENHDIHHDLQIALQARIGHLRAELGVKRYDEALIAEFQRYAEVLRKILYHLPRAEGPAPVATVMPVFIKENHKGPGLAYLCEAIDSVIHQDFDSVIDIILVNDASEVDIGAFLRMQYPKHLMSIATEDGSEKELFHASGTEGRRIRLINKRSNSGNDVAPRNLALFAALEAGTPYLAHLDSDDRMVPDRIRTSFAHLERERAADLLHGRHRCIDEHGNVVKSSQVDGWYNFARKFTFGMDQNDPANDGRSKRHRRDELQVLENDNWVHGGTVLYRSNIILRLGRENMVPTKRYGADHVYWQKISQVSTLEYLSRVLAEHRLHGGSMTQGGR